MKTANSVGGLLFCPQENSRGQSLIQVIIAVAILGIVSLGFMTMISQVMQAQKLAQARQDLITLSNDVQTAFANPIACQQALGAKGVTFDAKKAGVTFPPATGSTFANNGLPFSMQLNAQDTLKDNTTLKTYNLIANHVELVNAQPVGNDPSGNPVYKANIIGQFSPQGTGGHGLSDFATRQLAAGYFAVSGGNITGCSTSDLTNPFLSGGSTGSTAAAACTLIGGTYDDKTQKCATSSDLADLCPKLNGTLIGGKCAIAGGTGATGGAGGTRWSPTGGGGGKWCFQTGIASCPGTSNFTSSFNFAATGGTGPVVAGPCDSPGQCCVDAGMKTGSILNQQAVPGYTVWTCQ